MLYPVLSNHADFTSHRSTTLMLFPILAWKVPISSTVDDAQERDMAVEDFNMAGFILQAVLQSVVTLMLFVALDHERKFRSSGECWY